MSIKDQLSSIAIHLREQFSPKTPALFINQIAEETKEGLAIVTDNSFEVCLDSVDRGTYYIAEKILKRSEDGDRMRDVTISIVDSIGQLLKFTSPRAFLDFMSKRGYVMIAKDEDSFAIYYTFKRA